MFQNTQLTTVIQEINQCMKQLSELEISYDNPFYIKTYTKTIDAWHRLMYILPDALINLHKLNLPFNLNHLKNILAQNVLNNSPLHLYQKAFLCMEYSNIENNKEPKKQLQRKCMALTDTFFKTALESNNLNNEQKGFYSFKAALIHFLIGDANIAFKYLKPAWSNSNPHQFEASMFAIRILADTNQPLKSINNFLNSVYHKVVKTSKEQDRFLFEAANINYDYENYNAVPPILTKIIDNHQSSYRFDALFLISNIYAEQEQHNKSLFFYTLAKIQYPDKAPEYGWDEEVAIDLCLKGNTTHDACQWGITLLDSFPRENTDKYTKRKKTRDTLIQKMKTFKPTSPSAQSQPPDSPVTPLPLEYHNFFENQSDNQQGKNQTELPQKPSIFNPDNQPLEIKKLLSSIQSLHLNSYKPPSQLNKKMQTLFNQPFNWKIPSPLDYGNNSNYGRQQTLPRKNPNFIQPQFIIFDDGNNKDYVTKIRAIAKNEIRDKKTLRKFLKKLTMSVKRGTKKFFNQNITYGLNTNTQSKIEKIWESQAAQHIITRKQNTTSRHKIRALLPKHNTTSQEINLINNVAKNIPAKYGLTGKELKIFGEKISKAVNAGVKDIGRGGLFNSLSKNKTEIENAIKCEWRTKEFQDMLNNFKNAQPRNYFLDSQGNIQPKATKHPRHTPRLKQGLIDPYNTGENLKPKKKKIAPPPPKYNNNPQGFFRQNQPNNRQNTTPDFSSFTPSSPNDNELFTQQTIIKSKSPYGSNVLDGLKLPFGNIPTSPSTMNPQPSFDLDDPDLDTPTDTGSFFTNENQNIFDDNNDLGYPGRKNSPVGNSSP